MHGVGFVRLEPHNTVVCVRTCLPNLDLCHWWNAALLMVSKSFSRYSQSCTDFVCTAQLDIELGCTHLP